MSHNPHGGTSHHGDSEHRSGVPTLHSVVEVFARLERADLEEVAVEYSLAHARMCRLASGAEHAGDDHATDEQMTQRIGEMSTHELAELLAPPAWLAIVAHEQHA
jgi:hypothetical protein